MKKVITHSEETINNTIAKGQFLRNGNSRLFEITALNDDKIQLSSINGESVKNLILPRKTFVQLYFRKNYEQISSPERLVIEISESQKLGAQRLLIK